MEWYLPITILPAVGLLIMSTSSQMMALSSEIGEILSKECTPFQHNISDLKINQLSRLTRSVTLFYGSAAFFVVSGLISVGVNDGMLTQISIYVLTLAVFMVLIALCLLIIYGFKAINIRKMQHKHNLEMYRSSKSENN